MKKLISLFFLFCSLALVDLHGHNFATVKTGGRTESQLVIVPARVEELNFLVEFAIESNDIYQTRTAPRDVARKVFGISERDYRKGVVEVLKLKGETIGFYTLKKHRDERGLMIYELGHLFVKAGLQRRGYGTLLFRRALEVAKSKGWKRLQWISDPGAEEFYLKMGAKRISRCVNLLNPAVDLPIFEYKVS